MMSHKKELAIIDYGVGNLFSVAQALEQVGAAPRLISSPESLHEFEMCLLPGVGAFASCLDALEKTNFVPAIKTFAQEGKKIMGICVGMQLLFSTSEEDGRHSGLNLLAGEVRRIKNETNSSEFKLPHIGWKQIQGQGLRLFDSITAEDSFYFVHSYSPQIKDPKIKVGTAYHCEIPISCYVEQGNIFGCQFHPEKSRDSGLRLLKNFVEL